MSAVTRPRGPLPARVYWFRRFLVFGIAFALVFGLARLLGSGSDASSEATATQVGSEITQTPDATGQTTGPGSTGPTVEPSRKPKRKRSAEPEPPAQPDGPCDPADVVVAPTVDRVVADDEIKIRFEVTGAEPACTWQATRDSLVVRLTSGDDLIWTSQQCPQALPTKDLVVRAEQPARLALTWNGKRSDEDCTRFTTWALPGWYHATAAALGGEPTRKQFELRRAPRPTVTRTADPEPKQKNGESRPTREAPDGERDGAQEPNG